MGKGTVWEIIKVNLPGRSPSGDFHVGGMKRFHDEIKAEKKITVSIYLGINC